MTRKFTSALAGLILVILVAGPEARQQSPGFGTGGAVTSRDASTAPTTVNLLVGRSTIIDIGATIARVSVTVPDVADAMVTAPTQLLVHGKQPGTISMFVWDRMGAIRTFEVVVRRDLSTLVEQVRNLFPGEPVTVAGSGKDVVLSGTVTSKYVIDKAAELAGGYVEKKENVVNLLKQQEGVASNQVMLRVRFAEVSRNALQEVGASLFTDGNNNFFGRTTTQQFQAPHFDKNQPSAALGDTLVFSDYLNLFLFDAKNKVGGVIKALQTRGVFQSLAEPNLIATNGKEASFLAGGEFPYPVPQGQFGTFTIHFKEFGVRLTFTPTVLGGDLINLKIRPEVSSLDFNNAVVLEGFRIPALTTRRAETEVELRDGQTFAIAGLLNNTALSSTRKVPGLGDIPVLGLLFRSRAYQKEQTELVVMVTPQIVQRNSTGVSAGLPSLAEPFLGPNPKPIPAPAPYVGSPHPQSGARRSADNNEARQRVSDPVASKPIQAGAPLPSAPKAETKAAAKKAEEQRKQAEKLDKERAKQQAEADKKAAEVARKSIEQARRKSQEDQKKEKALVEAAAKLKQAQAAYQAELAKTNKGGQ